jgi:hypothetical protein
MINKKINLIDENNSPLQRIMSVYNSNEPNKKFSNNICAFHIGNGIIMSVAHNLRSMDLLPIMLSDNYYQNELKAKIAVADHPAFDQIYPIDPVSGKRILTGVNQAAANGFITKMNEAKVDRRYSKLYTDDCCKPFLVSSFKQNAFCDEAALNARFHANHSFNEQAINRHTFLIELELLDELINEDVAIYRIVNTDQAIIDKLPSLEVDFKLYDTGTKNYYCLQTAPYDNLGRIINEARIEGLLDNFSKENDVLGNSYIMDGTRYLIKGFFRFGSSGAPYVVYDEANEVFKVNAIQSQASFIQMAINNSMEGNRQYLNGIATPFSIIEEKVNERIAEANIV